MQIDTTESSIRLALLDFLKQEDDESCVYLSEMFVGGFARRADLVVANGNLFAFEIKSAADKLSRLEGQLDVYRAHFEATTVVCSHKHLDGVRKVASPGVGIWTISKNGEFDEVRRARLGRMTKSAWLQHLPVAELRRLLRTNGVRASHLSDRKSVSRACMRLNYDCVRLHALNYIKARDERNAAFKELAERKAAARCASSKADQQSIADWIESFSQSGPLRPIPRKVS